jgi:putative ABC transport system permease protein
MQFLTESASLTLLGGIIGVVCGILIALAVSVGVNYFGYEWKFIIAPSAIIIALFMAASVGICFGLWPANRASKMDPVEALRK